MSQTTLLSNWFNIHYRGTYSSSNTYKAGDIYKTSSNQFVLVKKDGTTLTLGSSLSTLGSTPSETSSSSTSYSAILNSAIEDYYDTVTGNETVMNYLRDYFDV